MRRGIIRISTDQIHCLGILLVTGPALSQVLFILALFCLLISGYYNFVTYSWLRFSLTHRVSLPTALGSARVCSLAPPARWSASFYSDSAGIFGGLFA
jgi:hypothetical protein